MFAYVYAQHWDSRNLPAELIEIIIGECVSPAARPRVPSLRSDS